MAAVTDIRPSSARTAGDARQCRTFSIKAIELRVNVGDLGGLADAVPPERNVFTGTSL
jgi:hypothetical protein